MRADTSYKKIQKKVTLQGFRQGKAPMNIVKKMYRDNIGAEVGEKLINGSLFDAIQEHKLKPIANRLLSRSNRVIMVANGDSPPA